MEKLTHMKKLKRFYKQCKRVWMIMKKPSRKEFETISKVSAIGIALIGLLGFIISITMKSFIK